MGRRHVCCHKQKLKKGLWSPEEDEKLMGYITKYGHGRWSSVPKLAGLERCGKSCRLRWINYLRPDLKRGTFSSHEERLIIELHETLGNRWSQIATQLPGRTDNEIKNFWNSCIKRKLKEKGIDPGTHKSIAEVAAASEDKSPDHQKSEDLGAKQDDIIRLKPSEIKANAFRHKEIFGLNSFSHEAVAKGYGGESVGSKSPKQLTDVSSSNPLVCLLPRSTHPLVYGCTGIFNGNEEHATITQAHIRPVNSMASCSSDTMASNQGIPRTAPSFSSLLSDTVLPIHQQLSQELIQHCDNPVQFWDCGEKKQSFMERKINSLEGSLKWSDLLLQPTYDSTCKDKANHGIPWQLQESPHVMYEKPTPPLQHSNISSDLQHIASMLDQI